VRKTGMPVIYEPRGKAREYSTLAVNLYTGCGHQCEYCYAPGVIKISKVLFSKPVPRQNILERLALESKKLGEQSKKGIVLLCFTCDPYQPIDEYHQLTRKAIRILHYYGLSVMILTKGGRRTERDFDLLSRNDWFGVTLTNLEDTLSLKWEPFAALPAERISSLQHAHTKGINTWVSLEPVLYPEIALEIIDKTHTFVDMFKVGMLNYHPHAKRINWHKFAVDIQKHLTELHCSYYLKEDLKKWL
jgi:DNA repair photolyase